MEQTGFSPIRVVSKSVALQAFYTTVCHGNIWQFKLTMVPVLTIQPGRLESAVYCVHVEPVNVTLPLIYVGF